MIGRWVVGVAVLFVILLLMLPDTDEQSLARIASTSMLACTKDMRGRVATQLLAGEPVDTAVINPCPDLIASLELTAQGEMHISGNKHELAMRLTPERTDGEIHWGCRGTPAESVTKLCKP